MSNVRVILDEEVDELIDLLMISADHLTNVGDRDTAGRCRRMARDIRDQRDAQIERERRAADQLRADTIEKVPDLQKMVPLALPPIALPPNSRPFDGVTRTIVSATPVIPPSPPPEPAKPVEVSPPTPPAPPPPKPAPTPPLVVPPPAVKIPVGDWPRNSDGVTRFMVQAGIGDIAWLFQKVHGLAQRWGSPVELIVAGDIPHRAQEFVELLPGVRFGGYGEFTSDEIISTMAEKPLPMTMDGMRGLTLPLSVNGHLERGGRIESWYPEIETETTLPLKTTDTHRARAKEILAREHPVKRPGRRPKVARQTRPVVGIYAASRETSRDWKFWDAASWAEIVTGIRRAVECDFAMIGAEWDDEFSQDIVAKIGDDIGSRIRRCMREPFGVTAEVLRGLDLLVAFPSGIPIVATMIGTPTIWWLRDKVLTTGGNVSQITGWIPKLARESGLIETRMFESPAEAVAGVLKSRPFAARIGRSRQ